MSFELPLACSFDLSFDGSALSSVAGGNSNDKPKAQSNGSANLDLAELKEMSISELLAIAKSYDVEGAGGMRKQELIFKVLAAQTEKSG